MLLSKALRMQQDLEDKKNKIIIEGLEKKIKDHEASLEKKDFLLETMEGSLTEAQAKVARLNDEILQRSEKFESAKIVKRASKQMLELRQPVRATAEIGLQLSKSHL